jgi:DNA-binding transcriptional LysR family regulator
VDIRFGKGDFDERASIPLFSDHLQVLASPEYLSRRSLVQPTDLQPGDLLARPCCPGNCGCRP